METCLRYKVLIKIVILFCTFGNSHSFSSILNTSRRISIVSAGGLGHHVVTSYTYFSSSIKYYDQMITNNTQENSLSRNHDSISSTRLFAHLNRNQQQRKLPVVPVIGPLPKAGPLIIGSEMSLNPTPLIWKSIQECVVVHRSQSLDDDKSSTTAFKSATINAAPIIAIIDDVTGSSSIKTNKLPSGGRYATLAAIVGIRPKSKNEEKDQEKQYGHSNKNSHDESDFLEYYANLNIPDKNGDTKIIPLESTIRLVGVGRCVIHDFFYQAPSMMIQDDEDEHLEDDNYGYEDNTPIVMAEFEPLVDDASVYSRNDPNMVGNKGVRSHRSSPVHAISKLSNVAHRVYHLHDQRRKLVSGLKAAKVRLDNRLKMMKEEILEDHDGLGMLYETLVNKMEIDDSGDLTMTIDEFLTTFGDDKTMNEDYVTEYSAEEADEQSKLIEKLETMDNYGLNYYGTLSSINTLTEYTCNELRQYYSKEFCSREEYPLEVSSFVAFRVLEGFLSNPIDIAWSLKCTSSYERLVRAEDIMMSHLYQLKLLAKKFSSALLECGEECTDLW